MNRFLVYILLILLVIIGGEYYYYLKVSKQKKILKTEQTITQVPAITLFITPPVGPLPHRADGITGKITKVNEDSLAVMVNNQEKTYLFRSKTFFFLRNHHNQNIDINYLKPSQMVEFSLDTSKKEKDKILVLIVED